MVLCFEQYFSSSWFAEVFTDVSIFFSFFFFLVVCALNWSDVCLCGSRRVGSNLIGINKQGNLPHIPTAMGVSILRNFAVSFSASRNVDAA